MIEHMNNMSESGSSVYSCKDVDNAVCFLVDDGAFMVATNHPDYKQQVEWEAVICFNKAPVIMAFARIVSYQCMCVFICRLVVSSAMWMLVWWSSSTAVSTWGTECVYSVYLRYWVCVLCLSEVLSVCTVSIWGTECVYCVYLRYWVCVQCLPEVLSVCTVSIWGTECVYCVHCLS